MAPTDTRYLDAPYQTMEIEYWIHKHLQNRQEATGLVAYDPDYAKSIDGLLNSDNEEWESVL